MIRGNVEVIADVRRDADVTVKCSSSLITVTLSGADLCCSIFGGLVLVAHFPFPNHSWDPFVR